MKYNSGRYQYIKLGKLYICLQQSPVTLFWLLYFKNKALHLDSMDLDKKQRLNSIKTLCKYYLHFRLNKPELVLPIYGEISLLVHRGYKIFNFQRKTVTKIIDADIDPTAVKCEIEGVLAASRLYFAPNIYNWNIEERWYEEDYVTGVSGTEIADLNSATLLEIYYQEIEQCLEKMILLQPSPTIMIGNYLEELSADWWWGHDRLLSAGLDTQKVLLVQRFIDALIEQLRHFEQVEINLALSHGDFSLVNVLITNDNHVTVIDWESTQQRSILSDFYNYFFTELWYGRATTSLVAEMNEALSYLQLHLAPTAPETVKDLLSLAHVYRRLYYFERICMLAKREPTEHRLDVILHTIDVFNSYEQWVTDSHYRHELPPLAQI